MFGMTKWQTAIIVALVAINVAVGAVVLAAEL